MNKPEDQNGNGALPEQLAAPQFRIVSVALNENECRNIVALMTTGERAVVVNWLDWLQWWAVGQVCAFIWFEDYRRRRNQACARRSAGLRSPP